MKKLLYKLPEIYFLVLAFLAGFSPPLTLNPLFGCVMLVILLQLILNNKIFGLILGILFFTINLFFLGAVLSEFQEMIAAQEYGSTLLLTGLSIWLVNLGMTGFTIYKYSKSLQSSVTETVDLDNHV